MRTMGRRPTVNLNLPPRMRARKKPGGTYYYYDAGGKPRVEIPLGPDYVEAVRKWGELEVDAKPIHLELVTFKYAADRYLKSQDFKVLAPRTQSDYIAQLKFIYLFFNDPPAPMSAIKTRQIQQYMKWRGTTSDGDRKPAPTRANRERTLISTIWNFARREGITDEPNPCHGVKGFTELGRDVYTEDEIFKVIYDCGDRAMQNAMDLAYLCAQRPADTLKMSETDIRDGALGIDQGKTKHKLRINVIGELKVVIDRIRAFKKGCKVHSLALVVKDSGAPLGYWGLRDRIDNARLEAVKKHPELKEQIEEFQFRDLRAKAGTDIAEEEDLKTAQKLLGHKNQKTTEIYVRRRMGEKVDPTK
jgi:integrase